LLSLLGPAILALIVALIGLAALWWMNKNRPQLHIPVMVSEEEPNLPFDEPAPTGMSPEERLLRAVFGEDGVRRVRQTNRRSISYDVRQSADEPRSS
jgi:hypothetical protein